MNRVLPMTPSLRALDAPAVVADIHRIPQAERVKLAMLLVRDVDEFTCIMPLKRLAEQAGDLSAQLMRQRYERDCG